ncbi:heavy-metal-associated domain-containing protein [Marinifilum sp.]|uniref:heavy-metal-associated domain-containing protein n=1 Tax=Marinifilum sp. TaxID=2033137 RepID=UPI003BAC6821
MKIKAFYLVLTVLLMGTAIANGQSKKEEFKVYGNCGMCENRIEKAALSVEGVTVAEWNKESKIISVTFNGSKTKVHEIHKAIANVGHDTEMHKAKNEVYSKLPGCCQYQRVALTSGHSHNHKEHSGCSHNTDKKSSDHSGCSHKGKNISKKSECSHAHKKQSSSCCNKTKE